MMDTGESRVASGIKRLSGLQTHQERAWYAANDKWHLCRPAGFLPGFANGGRGY